MTNRLFIAEKPSLGKAIAAELGIVKQGDGFIECRNNAIVTWCFGHMLELKSPDAYLPSDVPITKKGQKMWRDEDLPIIPNNWQVQVKADAKKQLKIIGGLLKDAKTVINAGDPDTDQSAFNR